MRRYWQGLGGDEVVVTYVSVFVPQQRGFSFKNDVVRRSKKPDSSRVRIVRKWLMSIDLGAGGRDEGSLSWSIFLIMTSKTKSVSIGGEL